MNRPTKGSTDLFARSSRETQSYPHGHSDASVSATNFPAPWNGPEWGDADTWEIGPWLPAGAVLVPPGMAPGDGSGKPGFGRIFAFSPRLRRKGVRRHGKL